MIHGNTAGIRESMLAELEKLYDAEFERDQFLPDRLLNILVRFTDQINREMLVYLGRDGAVLEIAIGDIGSIALPELHLRRNLDRLSGFRCIHTHPGGDARLSTVDLQALRLLRFDSMCAVGVQDRFGEVGLIDDAGRAVDGCRTRDDVVRRYAALDDVHAAVVDACGVGARVLPMSDDPVRTWIRSGGEWVEFQRFMIAAGAAGSGPSPTGPGRSAGSAGTRWRTVSRSNGSRAAA